MRIDMLATVLAKGQNDLEIAMEEKSLKKDIAKLLSDKGYTKFYVAGSDVMNVEIKNKVLSDILD